MERSDIKNKLRQLLAEVIAGNTPHRWVDHLRQYNPYEDVNGDYYKNNIRALGMVELDKFGQTLIEDAHYRSQAEKILANLLVDPAISAAIPSQGFMDGGIFGRSYYQMLCRAFAAWQEEVLATGAPAGFTADCESVFDSFIRVLSAEGCLLAIREAGGRG
jgi:hypothetical protein